MKGNIRTLFRNFCLDGSVLGLKYFYLFPDKFSRCFWLAWIFFNLFFAVNLAIFLYGRFVAMPTRITIENQFEPVESLPYPSITLCSPNQISVTGVQHFDKTLVNGNRSLDLTSTLRQLLGFYHFVQTDLDDLTQLQKLIELNRYTVPEVMMRLPQSCEQFLRMCVFRQRPYPYCRGLFRPVLTKHGLCCIFNNLYYYKSHKRNERDESFKPHLVGQAAGILNGLTVIADYDPDDAVDHTIHFAGATRVMFTDWTEFPADDESLLLAPATESFHFIHPTATYCSAEVQELPTHSRNCLLEDERFLQFFRKYRNSDCDMLCLVHAVEKNCKCLPFYLPHLRLTQVCEMNSIQCLKETILGLSEWQDAAECECPRDCDSRRYQVDTTVGNIKALEYMYRTSYGVHVNRSTSIMHFLFPTTVYEKQKQETVMSLTTLASNLGGVFGLCLGCSVMSILEICFYWYCAARNCAPARKAAPPVYRE